MNKVVVSLLAVCCLVGVCTNGVYAQKGRGYYLRSKHGKYQPRTHQPRQLKRKVFSSFRKANNIEDVYPSLQRAGLVFPASQFRSVAGKSGHTGGLENVRTHALYPQENLSNGQALKDHFLNQHNLEIIKWTPVLQARQKALKENLPQLREAQQTIEHPARLDMKWLAEQLPEDARYLLLGEKDHGVYTIHQQIKYLLAELHHRYPHRKIILFTEFLPQDHSWMYAVRHPGMWGYLPLFLAGQMERIPVVGLEPNFVFKTIETQVEDPELHDSGPMWASIEGVRIRNEKWLTRLQAARRQYPEALFVVYAGAGHVDYNEPYSLGKSLEGPQTKVVLFHPRYAVKDGRLKEMITMFDIVTQGEFSSRIVQFKSTKLARLAGFDIQIGVPELVETMFFDE